MRSRDFLASNLGNDADAASVRKAEQINAKQGTNMAAAAVWPALGVRPAYLEHLYETVGAKYGSVDGYLQNEVGLTRDEVSTLRDRYLE